MPAGVEQPAISDAVRPSSGKELSKTMHPFSG